MRLIRLLRRIRNSTWVLTLVFVVALVAYAKVKPEANPGGHTRTTAHRAASHTPRQSSANPSPAPVAERTKSATPTPTPTPDRTVRPSPTATTSPASVPATSTPAATPTPSATGSAAQTSLTG